MAKPLRKGAEEARSQLPELLMAAQRGRHTIITRHGRRVAVLAPISSSGDGRTQRSRLPLAGTGRGLHHPTLAPIYRPVFEAHDQGLVRSAVTTITIAEVLIGPLSNGDAVKDSLVLGVNPPDGS